MVMSSFIDPETIQFSDHAIGRYVQRVFKDLPRNREIPQGTRIQAIRLMRESIGKKNPQKPIWEPEKNSWLWESDGVKFFLNKEKTVVKTII